MKIAVVTGASSGFGRIFVSELQKCCKTLDEIWVVARRKERLVELAEKASIPIRVFGADLSKKNWDREFAEALKSENPTVRILINCAGYGKTGHCRELGVDEQLGMIDVNCRALTKMTLLCLPYLGSHGRIIQVSSAAAFAPQPGFAVYAASKAYVLSFSRALREEVAPKGISVTTVCPGPSETEFFLRAGQGIDGIKKQTAIAPEQIVIQALEDARKRRDVSVCGIPMKGARIACKLLPHSVITKVMARF
ncbi:MAG: SDR family NAD(P)-dependent oxidoreductase [Lachnospiraceae bacterium]|nr:SDR family NAD(P)-dependent oxidoreductase [Lachnospiraceae bacterium]